MRVLLLAGYKSTTVENCPWLQFEGELPQLENRLRQIRQITSDCVVVMAGESAEYALRVCPTLQHCELVFDTNANLSLMTNLKAALKLGCNPALVLPVEAPLSGTTEVKKLVSSAVQQGLQCPAHLLQGVNSNGNLWNGGFPLVLTSQGAQTIAKNRDLGSLLDPGLIYQEIGIESAS